MKIDPLTGKFVVAITMPHETVLLVETGDGNKHMFYATGDCCSESWIEDLQVSGLGGEFMGLKGDEDVSAPGTRQDYDLRTKFTLRTTMGSTTFTLVNSSNGYYSGDIDYRGLFTGKFPAWMNLKEEEE